MKDLKQKPYDNEDHEGDTSQEGNASRDGGDITQLDGSPDPNAVSKVAMGQKPDTLMEHDEIANADWIERLKGKKEHGDRSGVEDIDEAYAMLFEGLAGIMRCK